MELSVAEGFSAFRRSGAWSVIAPLRSGHLGLVSVSSPSAAAADVALLRAEQKSASYPVCCVNSCYFFMFNHTVSSIFVFLYSFSCVQVGGSRALCPRADVAVAAARNKHFVTLADLAAVAFLAFPS